MHRYRTPKALHPKVVLSFSHHFSLRPVVTDAQTDATSDFIYMIWLIPLVDASVATSPNWFTKKITSVWFTQPPHTESVTPWKALSMWTSIIHWHYFWVLCGVPSCSAYVGMMGIPNIWNDGYFNVWNDGYFDVWNDGYFNVFSSF
jgi:hypothetical protein